VHSTGQMTNTRLSDGVPEPDGALRAVVRKKILHHHQLYINRSDPIAFMPLSVDTSGRIYDDFSRLLFLHANREASAVTDEIPELDLSSRLFTPLPCFIRSRRPTTLLAPSLVFPPLCSAQMTHEGFLFESFIGFSYPS
jgi:hypothetical protein